LPLKALKKRIFLECLSQSLKLVQVHICGWLNRWGKRIKYDGRNEEAGSYKNNRIKSVDPGLKGWDSQAVLF
jgi:hypothetical protein